MRDKINIKSKQHNNKLMWNELTYMLQQIRGNHISNREEDTRKRVPSEVTVEEYLLELQNFLKHVINHCFSGCNKTYIDMGESCIQRIIDTDEFKEFISAAKQAGFEITTDIWDCPKRLGKCNGIVVSWTPVSGDEVAKSISEYITFTYKGISIC